MAECPNCERYKASASMWRNEAYRVAGHPLPWSPDEKLLRACLEAMEHIHRTGDTQVFDLCYAPELLPTLRARLEEKR